MVQRNIGDIIIPPLPAPSVQYPQVQHQNLINSANIPQIQPIEPVTANTNVLNDSFNNLRATVNTNSNIPITTTNVTNTLNSLGSVQQTATNNISLADRLGLTKTNNPFYNGIHKVSAGDYYYYSGNANALGITNKNDLANYLGADPEELNYDSSTGMFSYKIKKDFFDRNMNGINATIGTINTGIALGSLLEARATAKQQRRESRKNVELLDEKMKEAKEEYSRIKNLRKSLSTRY